MKSITVLLTFYADQMTVPVEGFKPPKFVHLFDGQSIFEGVARARFDSVAGIRSVWHDVSSEDDLGHLVDAAVVVCHSLSPRIISVVEQSSSLNTPVWWIGFGYDYCDLIFDSYSSLLVWQSQIGRLEVFLRGLFTFPALAAFTGQRAALIYALISWVRRPYRELRGEHQRQYKRVNVRRKIDFISSRVSFFSPVIPAENDLIEKKFHLGLRTLEWTYGVNGTLFKEVGGGVRLPRSHPQNLLIAVGNSATWEQNHLGLLPALGRISIEQGWKVVLPVASGYVSVRKAVVRKYRAKLGEDRLLILDHERSLRSFAKQIAHLTTFVSLSKRQLGVGTIKTALFFGVRVVLSRENPTFDYLESLGFFLNSTSEIRRIPDLLATPLPQDHSRRNSILAGELFGEDGVRAKASNAILAVVANSKQVT